MLEMKPECLACGRELTFTAAAYICYDECTYCPERVLDIF